MYQQYSPTPQRENKNHFLVFVQNMRLSPLILNDNLNSFEVFTITSTTEFVNCFQSNRPGCLVTDANNEFFDYPNLNLMSRLLPVVMVTNSSSVTAAANAAKKGANGVLRDFNDQDKIRDAIRAACFADCRGDLSPLNMRCRVNKLTTKERQVIYMSLRGKTTKIISGELSVCHQTVDKHKKRALSKLKSSSVVDLMNMLIESHNIASGIFVPTPAIQGRHQIPAPNQQPGSKLANPNVQ